MQNIINYFLSGIIMIITPIIFARIALNEKIKVSKTKSIVTILIFVIVSIFVNIYLINDRTSTINTLINCAIFIISFCYLYKIKYSKAILLTIIYIILLMIPDILLLIVSTEILGLTKDYCYEVLAGSLLSNSIISILVLLITLIIRKSLRKLMNYRLETNTKIIILTILTFICTLIFFYNAFINIEFNQGLFISVGIIIVFLLILFSLYKQKIDNNNLLVEYDKLLEFMQTYETEIEKQRILRHESKNQLITIKSKMYDLDDKSSVIKYIDSILEDENANFNQEKYAKYKYLPANGLKALFYFKAMEAEKKGISIGINVSEKIEKSFLSKMGTNDFKKLGRIIGVYFDNAIEASILSKNKILGIEIYKNENDIEIIISNSYTGNLETDKIGNKVFSTKGKNRGHGLLLVKSIVNESNTFKITTEVTDKLYIQKLIIKKPIN